MNTSGIYQIRNIVNNKIYVGSSTNIKLRFNSHKKDLRQKKHHSYILQRAWNKYGEESFVFEILEELSSLYISKAEQEYINRLNPDYNILKCVNGKYRNLLPETITKIKDSLASSRKLGIFLGKKHINNIIIAQKLRIYSEEERIERSARQIGNRYRNLPILQVGINGLIINEYGSAKEAMIENNWKDYSSINKCCRGNRKSAYGYIWKYKNS